ncbi:uncharacterized protein N7529_004240 [Penicillium soppii]|uniref:uncharacterized protein n=1 Tax=Penicillium soppii TaxID=69789 RepID=UPI002547F4B5|nr:uncharacterized protein N7529_004240 [Penicillium soppii]KAJ5871887.1 hypothetical protein N7529_004240 [Penicillium soppii]
MPNVHSYRTWLVERHSRLSIPRAVRWEAGTPLAHLYASPPAVEPAVTSPALSSEAFDSRSLYYEGLRIREPMLPRDAANRAKLAIDGQSGPAWQWFFFKWLPRAISAYITSIRPSISSNGLDSPTLDGSAGRTTAPLDIKQTE